MTINLSGTTEVNARTIASDFANKNQGNEDDKETTHLLANIDNGGISGSDRREKERTVVWTFVTIVAAVVVLVGSVDWAIHHHGDGRLRTTRWNRNNDYKNQSSGASAGHDVPTDDAESSSPSFSRYNQFQALGLSLYTGGAPLYLANGERNPECDGRHALGHLDQDDDSQSSTNSSNHQEVMDRDHLYCYLGHRNETLDVQHRLRIMKEAVERAHQLADPDPHVLKVFIAPEFFWRGRDGAYFFDEQDIPEDSCGEVCQVLSGLENLTASSRYQDWLFLMGTVITAEPLPQNDTWDYLFLNFAPLYRGYDPDQTTHIGQRFLVPKRYVSNIDFLTPLRHYNATLARQIIDEAASKARDRSGSATSKASRPRTASSGAGLINDTAVFNPFLDRGRYSNHVWDSYKAELNRLEYTMIEYGWLVVDGIVLTVEVCLDHDMGTALNSYTADVVTGKTTRIPDVNSFESSSREVPIPPSMAQLSLVSSAGMTINRGSIASTHNGYVFLQDGLGDKTSRMFYESECFAGLSFEGGTELVQRSALITPNEVVFQHRIQPPTNVHPLYPPHHGDWRRLVRGIFSTAKYEPGVVVYPVLDLPSSGNSGD